MKKVIFVFIAAFLLNLIWENFHVFLYAHYKGGSITESILLHATVVDAVWITLITAPFLFFATLRKYRSLIVVIGVVVAIGTEVWALGTGRWAYNAYMPIIPFLSVGLTPAVQLGLLGYVSYLLTLRHTKSLG